MASGIYQIRNTLNDKVYIGSSIDLKFRQIEHFRYLRGGYHANVKLQRAFDHYGDALVFEILELVPVDDLLIVEQRYLDQLDFRANYNIATTAGSPMKNRKHTDDSKQRMSVNTSGDKNPMYGVQSPMMGRRHTEAVKKQISKQHTGSGNPMYGKSGALSPTSKKIIVDGVQYDSITLASIAIGVSRKVVEYRIKSVKYPGYQKCTT
jgi:group I intron endonuclease